MSTTSRSDFPPARHDHIPIAPSLVNKRDDYTAAVPQPRFPELCRTDDPHGGAAAWALLAVGMALLTCVLFAVAWAVGVW
ncbi:MAG: hypothetical protein JO296_04275 [Pseudonocardiales bacterium]|nr:hypothetical protein [Pseudonocardiales bacterium]MBV9649339.1 hypothetical protein [Pseudonocardiales bacterium]